jgi:4-hydroxy-tetrahydrodipicolinate synthase
LSWLAGIEGVQAIVCNGHAGEVSSLNNRERRRALGMALDEVGSRVAVINGIFTDNTLEAVEMAKEAKTEGASGLLVFPPTLFMWGAQLRPEMALTHFQRIADATDLPIIVFEYPPASGIGYDPDTLAALARIENVVASKIGATTS